MTRYHGHRISNTPSRKCVVYGQTNFVEIMVAMIILVGCISSVSGETIIISYSTGSNQPEEGDTNYRLQCLITNTESPVIAWSKDDNLLFWSLATGITYLDMTGDYMIQERYSNPITHFILTFTQVRNHHAGMYTCFTATGETQNFNVVQSSVVYITVIPGPFAPSVTDTPIPTLPARQYFPSSEWPKCYPQNDIKALIYSQVDLTCVSTPGNPMVEVNIYDPSNGQMIPNSDSIINKTTNRIERIYTYQVIPTDNMDQFYCQIIDGIGMNRQCTMGKIEIGLFRYDCVEVNQGTAFAFFQCLAGSRNAIHWSTEPPIESSRLETTGNVLSIHNVEMTDNGTKVICHVDGYNLQDQITLIVIPHTTNIVGSTVESSSHETIPSTTSVIVTSILGTAACNQEKAINVIGLFVGVCFGLSVIMFGAGLVVGIFCYHKKLNRHNSHEQDVSANTRNSTIHLGQVTTRLNPSDSANIQNSNLTNKTDHSPIVAPATTQSNDESYTDLKLTDVHRSQYASLKKPEAVGPNRDYVNPQRDKEPTYEVHIGSNM